ncbi:MAG: homoserine kinase [Myxococcales bacterium]|nr:homoserine kinase [Myxococcales bacterium]
MARLTPLDLPDARVLGAAFGLDVAGVAPVSGGSVNSNFCLELADGRRVFLRIYEEQDRAGAVRELSRLGALARHGVPTPEPLMGTDGERVAAYRAKPVAMFPWVDGEIVCQARVRSAHARAVGGALAGVHLAAARADDEGRFTVADLQARLSRVREVSSDWGRVADDLSERLSTYTSRRDPELPAGLIHGDLFRDNVLWRGETIAALIDFESASRGPFVYDLMVCVHAWCFGDHFVPELVEAALAGYHAVRRLSPAEQGALEVEAALGALRFAITRITDYSLRAEAGQPPLRDYRRFLQRLAEIEAGVLVSARHVFG